MLVEVVEHNLRNLTLLQLNDDTHAVAIRFVAQIGDTLDLLVPHQIGNVLNEVRFVNLVWQLRNHEGLALGARMDLHHRPGTHGYRAAAGGKSVAHATSPIDKAACREIGAGHHLHQFIIVCLMVLNQRDRGIDRLAKVVRRDIGCHAHGNALRTVDQQVRISCRQYHGLLQRLVVVGGEINGLLLDVRQQFGRKPAHARLGIAHGGR